MRSRILRSFNIPKSHRPAYKRLTSEEALNVLYVYLITNITLFSFAILVSAHIINAE